MYTRKTTGLFEIRQHFKFLDLLKSSKIAFWLVEMTTKGMFTSLFHITPT
jgi:hypothetical protein